MATPVWKSVSAILITVMKNRDDKMIIITMTFYLDGEKKDNSSISTNNLVNT
jgi:hypothetical protein